MYKLEVDSPVDILKRAKTKIKNERKNFFLYIKFRSLMNGVTFEYTNKVFQRIYKTYYGPMKKAFNFMTFS
jgi:hypothetical protein